MNQRRNRWLAILIIIIIGLLFVCIFNKTCFRRNYEKTIGTQEITIGVPFFSYFNSEKKDKDVYIIDMTTLREYAVIKEEISDYLATLTKLECHKGYYYDKESDITIQKYDISRAGFWISNTININYSLGQYCTDIVPEIEPGE